MIFTAWVCLPRMRLGTRQAPSRPRGTELLKKIAERESQISDDYERKLQR